MKDKKSFRRALIEQRRQFSNRDKSDNLIYSHFIESKEYKSCKAILIYVSVGFEVDTIKIINHALKNDKLVYIPLCDTKSETMEFYRINSLSDTVEGSYGIPEPVCNEENLYKPKDYNDIIVVPGLAFDRVTMHRIGYGKGYYDKYLASHKLISVGLCYKKFFIEDIPTDDYDISINIIITDYE